MELYPLRIRAVSGWTFSFINLESAARRLHEPLVGALECLVLRVSPSEVPTILAGGIRPSEHDSEEHCHLLSMSTSRPDTGRPTHVDRGTGTAGKFAVVLDVEALLTSERVDSLPLYVCMNGTVCTPKVIPPSSF